MNHCQLVREIARRLPRLKRRDITEVLAVQHELWLADLSLPEGSITLGDLGKLVVEVQQKAGGGSAADGGRRICRTATAQAPVSALPTHCQIEASRSGDREGSNRMKRRTPNAYSERMTVNLTPEQMRRLEELRNLRARAGRFVSKNDLLRDAVNYYLASQDDLPGSRRAIAKGIERKVDGIEVKLDALGSRSSWTR